ncbi:NAD-dependent epimerase/dehydratase family protein [Paraburkholderia fynbosensis]|uniref:Uronate dehydrogenase n=1 Tax=Paraburkholderia fynbosensis TaxID=1200993 RepID=A0A6J5GX93_9BURK|nr:NAD(P)-dependent oxidoreductase [Paraburkholderia fynbosensis]CAB3806943.1 Uronate dehydrogenase [Paraburkholderia fynbosensis]
MQPKKVTALLTGASGKLGREIAAALSGHGWKLRLTDIQPFPGTLPADAEFRQIDLADEASIVDYSRGADVIVHFGGQATDRPFRETVGPNIEGIYSIYEAARTNKCRVVYASSSHCFGFYRQDERLDYDCMYRPDSYYGLSKAYGELMARLYWDKHGVESLIIRIGSAEPPEPLDQRMLATWLSRADLNDLIIRGGEASNVGWCVVWATSDNRQSFWANDLRDAIQWTPTDSADPYIEKLQGVRPSNEIEAQYQGAGFCANKAG